jgi:hypothetical protein
MCEFCTIAGLNCTQLRYLQNPARLF